MPLNVTVEEKEAGTYTVRPVGSIDSNTFDILGTQLEAIFEKSPKIIIFDMKDVSFVSSAGVGVILVAEQSLKSGGKILLVNLQPQIKKVFDIVKALPDQQVFTSLTEMDKYLKEIQRKVKEGEIE
jgi:anti-sigma B factor antagonist